MILNNAKIYSDGTIREGALLISDGIIESIKFASSKDDQDAFVKKNSDGKVIDCEKRLILPGIIDIHSHLRDMGQSEKETFLTGTKAAAFSGITTVLAMPNTKPPAIHSKQVKSWMEKAEKNIHVDVGFIAGVPRDLNFEEVKNIIKLGVFGFKIYPLSSLNEIDWYNDNNIQKLLSLSYEFQIPIFIHPDYPISKDERFKIFQDNLKEPYSPLKLHNKLYPKENETKYVNFILDIYNKILNDKTLIPEGYPILHFCHISCRESYLSVKKIQKQNEEFKISFEVTPHHLLLSNEIQLNNFNYGKVLPPLRNQEHSAFLFKELEEGNIEIIGTDHAPHTINEKSKEFNQAPSGFPGFETYPLLLLDKVFKNEISIRNFVRAASEKPAEQFKLKNKGFIKAGYEADLLIIEQVPEYAINSSSFKTKAKFSPYDGFKTRVSIWKVFLRGEQININNHKPSGKIVIRE